MLTEGAPVHGTLEGLTASGFWIGWSAGRTQASGSGCSSTISCRAKKPVSLTVPPIRRALRTRLHLVLEPVPLIPWFDFALRKSEALSNAKIHPRWRELQPAVSGRTGINSELASGFMPDRTLRLPGRDRPMPKVSMPWPNHGKASAAYAGRLASRVPFASQTACRAPDPPGPAAAWGEYGSGRKWDFPRTVVLKCVVDLTGYKRPIDIIDRTWHQIAPRVKRLFDCPPTYHLRSSAFAVLGRTCFDTGRWVS